MQDNFEFSAYLMYQVFPIIKDMQSTDAKQISVWVDNDTIPNVAIGDGIGPKWGAPMIRLTIDYEDFAQQLVSTKTRATPDDIFESLVISVFKQILQKAHLLQVNREKFIACFQKDKEEVDSLKKSLLTLLPSEGPYGAH